MGFKNWMIQKIGKENYISHFPNHYSEIEIVTFAQEWHESEMPKNAIINPHYDSSGRLDGGTIIKDGMAIGHIDPKGEEGAKGVDGSTLSKEEITAALHKLSDSERLEVFEFCKYCGGDNPNCQCWNDD